MNPGLARRLRGAVPVVAFFVIVALTWDNVRWHLAPESGPRDPLSAGFIGVVLESSSLHPRASTRRDAGCPDMKSTGLVLLIGLGTIVGRAEAQVAVIPAPNAVTAGERAFRFSSQTVVTVEADVLALVVDRQLADLRRISGLPLIRNDDGGASVVRVTLDATLPAEGYVLSVSADELTIESAGEAGVFYAFQTLRQLLPATATSAAGIGGATWVVPAVRIEDAPRFAYRGLHLDVGRHFFDVEFVKRYIDTMSRFKLNTFHWHLTEDQGWRVEIDAFPRLTEVGAWRTESPVEKNLDPYVGDGVRHGGYYTKDEIREVVAFAAERFVTVIPEIEMPGHATAAIASYPELGCTDQQLDVSTTWGVHDTVFCPSEETFAFLETVLSEVMELFPAEYIHIGGDEVPKRQWGESASTQALMAREGLADEEELQSWFIQRIEGHLRANGRRLIGWDEILAGGLAQDATVMSWRGTQGAVEAARLGHDVIMTPTEYAYFDFYQADSPEEPLAMNWAGFPIPLEKVYAWEPVPSSLSEAEAQHVIGAQGNVWTEYIQTPDYVEYMTYPRALALSEVVWSLPRNRSWEGFVRRLDKVLPYLDMMGVEYRFPRELVGAGAGR